MTEKPSIPPIFIQCCTIGAAAAIAWGASQSNLAALAKTGADHEIRIRENERAIHDLRRDILTGVLDLKGEFGVIKSRLTSIEKNMHRGTGVVANEGQ